MVKYNKNILNPNETIFQHLEKMYGPINTYNSKDLKEIKNYNIPLKGGKTYITTTQKKLQTKKTSGFSFIEIIIIINLVIIIVRYIIKYIYRLKLHGILIPIGFGLIITIIYNIIMREVTYLRNTMEYDPSRLIKENKTLKTKQMIINMLYKLPTMIPEFPLIPYPNVNKSPFKPVREGLMKLYIKYKINVDEYKLTINIPSIAFDFFNPVAAMCCAWSFFAKVINKLIDTVIKPFCNFVMSIFNPIKNFILRIKRTIIDPIWEAIMTIFNGITSFFNKIRDAFEIFFLAFLKTVGKIIPPLKKYARVIELNKLKDIQDNRAQAARMKAEKKKGDMEEKIRKKAAKKGMKKYAGSLKRVIKSSKKRTKKTLKRKKTRMEYYAKTYYTNIWW